MRFPLSAMVILSVLAAPAAARAEETPGSAAAAPAEPPAAWEVLGGASAHVGGETYGDTPSAAGSSDMFFDLGGGYGYFLTPQWELLAHASVSMRTASSGANIYMPRAGIGFNFSSNTRSSVFLDAVAGPRFEYERADAHLYSLFSYDFRLGKRFPLWDRVCWAPYVFVAGQTAGAYTDSSGDLYHLASYVEWGAYLFSFALVF